MLKVVLGDKYKSLFPFESEALNDLTIITGKNGSGKTQLLDLIGKKHGTDLSMLNIRLDLIPNLKRIQVGGIEKTGNAQLSYNHWKASLEIKFDEFRRLSNPSKELLDFIFTNNINVYESENSLHAKTTIFSKDLKYSELLLKIYSEKYGHKFITPDKPIATNYERDVLPEIFFPSQRRAMIRVIGELKKIVNKSLIDLQPEDFYNTTLFEHFVDTDDRFSSQIELIFYNYAKRRDLNDRRFYRKVRYSEENDSISDTDFINKFPPPWVLINQILKRHRINFFFQEIRPAEFDPQVNYAFRPVNINTEQPIEFSDLSSGEKTIIGLIIKIFTSEYYWEGLSFPELIILDEPDAHLHPEMSKLLIDVLAETFVKKFGIKVIVSTHSPSTIALSPEVAIYELKNGPQTSLKKITKDHALSLLTGFIPTLSIDYKNHRQVFVESPTDIEYFQALYDKHSQECPLDHKLYFISNAMGKGNCAQVFSIVKAIRESGNKTSFGIVDWDGKNAPKENVVVHGTDERYSIENFILDPIYLITLLIQMNDAHDICGITGLNRNDDEYQIGTKSEVDLQKIFDAFFSYIEKKFPMSKATASLVEIKYLNNKIVKVPSWYITDKGHDLVIRLKEVFDALKKYSGEGALQEALIPIMSKSYPFVPLTSVQLIVSLASGSLSKK